MAWRAKQIKVNFIFVYALLFTFLFLLTIAASAEVTRPPAAEEVERELAEFERDSYRYMNRIPEKRHVNRNMRFDFLTPEPKRGMESRDELLDAKDAVRAVIMGRAEVGIRVEAGSKITRFLDRKELKATGGRILNDLREMEARGFTQKMLMNAPWSGHFWPTYKGLVSQRYESVPFRKSGTTWVSYFHHVTKPEYSFLNIYRNRERTPAQLNELSPAEKYDLLIGNLSDSRQGYLNLANWKRGQAYQKKSGKVEPWFGVCHGWAPASFMVARPSRAIRLVAADGRTEVTFYPSDIKGLVSELWAHTKTPTRFIGQRCNIKKPKKDSKGRIISEKCFDVNPAIWHIGIVNQLAGAERNLIMDSTFDYEVWNYPVFAYSYTYFNPQTRRSSRSLENSVIRISSYKKDKFKRYRSDQAKYVVGIAMNVHYVDEARPAHRPSDDPSWDDIKEVTYLYDLELDAKKHIIGGEWYSNAHPDFIWAPPARIQARTSFESAAISDWDGIGPIPSDWRAAAKDAALQAQPLARIVEALVSFSSGEFIPTMNE